jgi:hypothetical protein
MTQVRYGSFSAPVGTATWKVRTRTLANDLGLPASRSRVVEVAGQLQGTGPADIYNQSRLLDLALSSWGQDLALTLDDGTVVESLTNATSLGGTRVTEGPDFPNGDGADATTYRDFRFVVEATYPIAAGNVEAFEEEVETRGGGPKYGFLPVVNGPPIRQMLFSNTPYFATQQGTAVGLVTYPTPPPPLWPGALLEAPVIRKARPRMAGGVVRDYRISWAYSFGSQTPLA